MKSQTTLEFTLIVSAVVLATIVFIGFYLKYSYSSAMSVSISSPDFVQNFYPLNFTHAIVTTEGSIPTNTLNITFLFRTPSGNESYTINYTVLNESRTQSGGYAYLLNISSTPTYDPYTTNYTVCDIGYTYQNHRIAITNINKC